MEKIYIGEIGGYKYWLGDIIFKGLDWYQAKDVCRALGDGWELPSKEVMKMVWENSNTQEILKSEEGWYWSSSEYSASHAWLQPSASGNQHVSGKTYTTDGLIRPVYKEKVEDKPTLPDHKVFYTRLMNPDVSICNLSGITYIFSKNEDNTYSLHASVCRGDNFSKDVGKDLANKSAPIFKNIKIGESGGFSDFLYKHKLYIGVYLESIYSEVEKKVLNFKRYAPRPNESDIKKEMEEYRKRLEKVFLDYNPSTGFFSYPKEVGEYTLRITKKDLGLLLGLVGKTLYHDMKGGTTLYRKLSALDGMFASAVRRNISHLPAIFTRDLEGVVDKILEG